MNFFLTMIYTNLIPFFRPINKRTHGNSHQITWPSQKQCYSHFFFFYALCSFNFVSVYVSIFWLHIRFGHTSKHWKCNANFIFSVKQNQNRNWNESESCLLFICNSMNNGCRISIQLYSVRFLSFFYSFFLFLLLLLLFPIFSGWRCFYLSLRILLTQTLEKKTPFMVLICWFQHHIVCVVSFCISKSWIIR